MLYFERIYIAAMIVVVGCSRLASSTAIARSFVYCYGEFHIKQFLNRYYLMALLYVETMMQVN